MQNPTQSQVLKRDLQDAYLGGLMDTATGNLSLQNWIMRCGLFRIWNWEWRRCDRETGCLENSYGETRDVQKLKGQTGHTIYTRFQPQSTMRKQCSQSSGRSTDENMTTLWMIWTWVCLFGACFWIPLFAQQFILDKTMMRIHVASRIIFGTVWDSYSMKLVNRSVNKKKSLV